MYEFLDSLSTLNGLIIIVPVLVVIISILLKSLLLFPIDAIEFKKIMISVPDEIMILAIGYVGTSICATQNYKGTILLLCGFVISILVFSICKKAESISKIRDINSKQKRQCIYRMIITYVISLAYYYLSVITLLGGNQDV